MKSTEFSFFAFMPALKETPIGKLTLDILKKYGDKPDLFDGSSRVFNLTRQFARMVGALDDNDGINRGKIEGLKVLDLACGAAIPSSLPYPGSVRDTRMFEPWLTRTLAHLGADVTGVDIRYPQYRKERVPRRDKRKGIKANEQGFPEPGWRFVQRDLLQIGAIDRTTFPDEHYDAVVSVKFLGGAESSNAPEISILKMTDPDSYKALLEEFNAQVLRVLKDNGKYMLNDRNLRKVEGRLV